MSKRRIKHHRELEKNSVVSARDVARSFPKRSASAHKGIGGKLLVIGGSVDYYGAPILVGLAALHTGCDLVRLYVPACNFDVTRKPYPDFIVKKYAGNYFSVAAAKKILKFANECDAIVIGPGLGKKPQVAKAVAYFLKHATKPIVIDADAILPSTQFVLNKVAIKNGVIFTPHRGEFARLTKSKISSGSGSTLEPTVAQWSKKLHTTILLKGPTDIIASPQGEVRLNTTGNPGMTVGGTGDVLTGIAAALLAQDVAAFTAAQLASYINGAAGDRLYDRMGIGYTASDLANEISITIHSLYA